ncbi:VOC family protein [Chryseolinea sp. H1M3-3]|uniref:VOC family protein n=1 Tax=Chryseolinea sp. H1M3-3 TaxID=3034144 RepID=UPI0023EDB504|nr:VOC family protein [Chryseolinea sp. H1M3-3]
MLKLIVFTVVISLTGVLRAQETTTSLNFTLDHVALSVTDVNRAAKFCADVLKLEEITNRSKLKGVRWFSLGPGRELHLISIVKENVMTNKAIHIALTTSDFDAFIKILDARKIPYSDWPGNPQKFNIRADGIKQVFFQGFEGYWFEVNSVAK